MTHKITAALVVLSVSSCATIQIPAEQLQNSESSIRGAEELGASSVPTAKLHIQLAKDQTEVAKKMAADGDTRAPLVLARAEADAELALALAREAAVHGDAVKANEDLKALKARETP